MLAQPTTRLQVQPFDGPTCPRCNARLMADWIRTGIVRCPDCNGDFEATAFKPPSRELHVEHVLATGPIEANACANHAKNAAVTACQRCGLLICALCDMNVGTGSYCPACFDRLRSENALQGATTRYRDYASMARISAIAGLLLLFLGAPFGAASLYYASKGFKQLRAEGRSIVGLVIVVVFAFLETLGGLAFILLMIYGLAKGTMK
jgi:ribosomal protein L37AE/L43A